jgi:hypothetical protein
VCSRLSFRVTEDAAALSALSPKTTTASLYDSQLNFFFPLQFSKAVDCAQRVSSFTHGKKAPKRLSKALRLGDKRDNKVMLFYFQFRAH